MTDAATQVLVALEMHATPLDPAGLAAATGLNVTTVRAALRRLKERGAVVGERRSRAVGAKGRRPTYWTLAEGHHAAWSAEEVVNA